MAVQPSVKGAASKVTIYKSVVVRCRRKLSKEAQSKNTMAESSIWTSINQSGLSIASALLLLAITGDHFSYCSPTPMWTNICTLSGNAFFLKQEGYEAIKAAGDNAEHVYLIDLVRITTIIQFVGAFISWILYTIDSKLASAALTTLTHFAGWVLLGAVVAEVPYFNELIDPSIIGSQADNDFSYGNGIVMSIVATSLQLVTVGSILMQEIIFA